MNVLSSREQQDENWKKITKNCRSDSLFVFIAFMFKFYIIVVNDRDENSIAINLKIER